MSKPITDSQQTARSAPKMEGYYRVNKGRTLFWVWKGATRAWARAGQVVKLVSPWLCEYVQQTGQMHKLTKLEGMPANETALLLYDAPHQIKNGYEKYHGGGVAPEDATMDGDIPSLEQENAGGPPDGSGGEGGSEGGETGEGGDTGGETGEGGDTGGETGSGGESGETGSGAGVEVEVGAGDTEVGAGVEVGATAEASESTGDAPDLPTGDDAAAATSSATTTTTSTSRKRKGK